MKSVMNASFVSVDRSRIQYYLRYYLTLNDILHTSAFILKARLEKETHCAYSDPV